MAEYISKQKPFAVSNGNGGMRASTNALDGPWESINAFETWYASKCSNPVPENGTTIRITLSDGTMDKYEWNKPTNGTGKWTKVGSQALASFEEAGTVIGGNEDEEVNYQIPCPIVGGIPYNGINMVEVEEDGFFVVDPHFNVGFCITPDNVASWIGGITPSGGGSSSDQSTAIAALRYQVNRIINILGDFYDQSDSTGGSDGKIEVE